MTVIEKALEKATDTKACVIADGAVDGVPGMFKEQFPGASAAMVVADPRTWDAAGLRTATLLESSGIRVSRHIVEPGGRLFHAEYRYSAEVRDAVAAAGHGRRVQLS